MAANLAQGSKLAVFTENEFLLESAMKSVTGDADFAYVLIYGENWKVLADPAKQATDVKGLIQVFPIFSILYPRSSSLILSPCLYLCLPSLI